MASSSGLAACLKSANRKGREDRVGVLGFLVVFGGPCGLFFRQEVWLGEGFAGAYGAPKGLQAVAVLVTLTPVKSAVRKWAVSSTGRATDS